MGVRGRIVAGLVFIAALALPGSAGAVGPYYAAPAALGAADCSAPADACTIYTAVGMATTPGDQVLLADGTYSLDPGTLAISLPATLKPQTAGTRPLLSSTNGNPVILGGGARIEDLAIDISGLAASARALDVIASTAARTEVRATGAASLIAVQVRDGGLLTDSTARTSSATAAAVLVGGSGGTVRNVTGYATGAGADGFVADGNFAPGANLDANVHNSVFRGGETFDSFDLGARPDAGTIVTVDVDHSNYVTAGSDPGATINDLGGNQSESPLFADTAAGDFTQLPGSPTIDAGASLGGLGPLEFDGGPRVRGLAPDIGADEFPSPDAPPSPIESLSPPNDKVRIVVRCPRKAERPRCKVKAVGRLSKTGPNVTDTVKRKLRPGTRRPVTLTVQPEFLAQVQAADRVVVLRLVKKDEGKAKRKFVSRPLVGG